MHTRARGGGSAGARRGGADARNGRSRSTRERAAQNERSCAAQRQTREPSAPGHAQQIFLPLLPTGGAGGADAPAVDGAADAAAAELICPTGVEVRVPTNKRTATRKRAKEPQRRRRKIDYLRNARYGGGVRSAGRQTRNGNWGRMSVRECGICASQRGLRAAEFRVVATRRRRRRTPTSGRRAGDARRLLRRARASRMCVCHTRASAIDRVSTRTLTACYCGHFYCRFPRRAKGFGCL